MWLTLIIYYYLLANFLTPVRGHIPGHLSTPSNRIDQYCVLSESCVHDTIPICGKNADEKRTFLDSCDLLEYACDTGDIFMHIDDEPGCPKPIRI